MDAFVALAAVIAGGLLTALGAYANDRVRAREQRATRWDERKVEIYAGFAEAVEDNISGLIHISDCRTSGDDYYDQDYHVLLGAYRQYKERLRSYHQRVRLVGDADLRHLAADIVKEVKTLQELEGEKAAPRTSPWKAQETRIKELNEQLLRAGARELGFSEDAATTKSKRPFDRLIPGSRDEQAPT